MCYFDEIISNRYIFSLKGPLTMNVTRLKFCLKSALRSAVQRYRRPLLPCHSFDWGREDHQHVCYAVRLLEEDDFRKVCPLIRQGKAVRAEMEDYCSDMCPYLGFIEFNHNSGTGEYAIELFHAETATASSPFVVKGEAAKVIYDEMQQKPTQASKNGALKSLYLNSLTLPTDKLGGFLGT